MSSLDGRAGMVQIEGLASVKRQMGKLSQDVDYRAQEFLPVNRAIADAVAGDAKQFVPVLSGALSASIRALSSKTSARVRVGGVKIPYAGPIHYGWAQRGIRPQPFLLDAIDKRRGEIKDRYDKLINTLIKKYDLDDKRRK